MLMDSDALELVERIKSGHEVTGPIEELYGLVRENLLARLHADIPARVRPRLDPDDVLDEAFLRALGGIQRFAASREGAVYSWIHRIALNLIADTEKRRSVGAIRFAVQESEQGPRASQVQRTQTRPSSRFAQLEWIESVFQRLRPDEAEVIRLRRLEGLSFEAVAERLGKTPGAVQRFYSRAWNRFCKVAVATDE